MKYLLDTNVVSEATRPSPNERVLNWLTENSVASAISAVTLGELWQGIEMLDEGKRKTSYKNWFTNVRTEFDENIISIDFQIMKMWGSYCASLKKKGIKPSAIDSLIAATALHNGLIVVTRNTSDFPEVEIFNPFA